MKRNLLETLADMPLSELKVLRDSVSSLIKLRKLVGGVEEIIAEALRSSNPVGHLHALELELHSHANPSYANGRTLEKLDREEYDRRRGIIKDAMYEYFVKHKEAPRTGVPIQYIWDNIQKVRKVARNKPALAGYIKSINTDPDSPIKLPYERVSQTYSVILKKSRPRH